MKIKKIISDIGSSVGDFLILYAKSLSADKIMNVRYIQDGYFELFGGKRVYVAKIETDTNFFENIEISKLRNDKKDDHRAQLYYFVHKSESYQSVWVCSFEKSILDFIISTNSNIVGSANKEDVSRFLLDIYNINKYQFNKDTFELDQQIDYTAKSKLENLDPFFINFRSLIKEHAYNSTIENKLYQVIKYNSYYNVIHRDVFRGFNGVFCTKIDLSHDNVLSFVKNIERQASNKDIEIKDATEDFFNLIKNNFADVCLTNTVIITKDPNGAFSIASRLGYEISEMFLSKADILRKTMLLASNPSYNTLIQSNQLEQVIGSWNKKIFSIEDVKKEKHDAEIDIYGYDIFWNMINHSFKACKSPHVFLSAETGLGKSVALQTIMARMIGFDIKEGRASRFYNNGIRYMEKGISNYKFMKVLQEAHGEEEVGLLAGEEEETWFSLFDYEIDLNRFEIDGYKTPKEMDLNFSIAIIDVVLDSCNEKTLTGLEQDDLKRVIKQLYRYQEQEFKSISKIMGLNERAYGKDMNRLLELGYDKYDTIDKVVGYDNYKTPTLDDVIMKVTSLASNVSISTGGKERLHNLESKLSLINTLKVFSYFNSTPLHRKQIWSVDFQHIAENKKIFTGYFLNIFYRFYKEDVRFAYECAQKNEPKPRMAYFIEEYHNYNKFDSFREIFKEIKKEARKWNITFFPISQSPMDFITQTSKELSSNIPLKISGYGTMMFLVPPRRDAWKETLDAIKDVGINTNERTEYMLQNLRPYMLGVISDSGTFGISLNTSEEELKLFNSD